MAITTSEFFEFCKKLDKDIKEIDITTNYGMGFYINNLQIKAYEPIINEDGRYNLLGTIMVDTKFLDEVVEEKMMERFAEKLIEKHSTPNIRPELLGVGNKRWYRTIVHNLKELETAASISNALYKYFNRTVEMEMNRLLLNYK